MAYRSKDPSLNSTANLQIRCSPTFKAEVDAMFRERKDGDFAKGLSEVVRKYLGSELDVWKKSKKGAE